MVPKRAHTQIRTTIRSNRIHTRPPPSTKLQDKIRLARYLQQISPNIIQIIMMDTNQLGTAGIIDLHHHYSALDPAKTMEYELKIYQHHHKPTIVTESTPAPQKMKATQKYPYQQQWKIAHGNELQQIDDQKAFEWLTPQQTTKKCKTISLTKSYRYKRHDDG